MTVKTMWVLIVGVTLAFGLQDILLACVYPSQEWPSRVRDAAGGPITFIGASSLLLQ